MDGYNQCLPKAFLLPSLACTPPINTIVANFAMKHSVGESCRGGGHAPTGGTVFPLVLVCCTEPHSLLADNPLSPVPQATLPTNPRLRSHPLPPYHPIISRTHISIRPQLPAIVSMTIFPPDLMYTLLHLYFSGHNIPSLGHLSKLHIHPQYLPASCLSVTAHSFTKAGPQSLVSASDKGRLAVVKALLAAGADKEAKDNVSA